MRENDWRRWMLDVHIPAITTLPYFTEARLVKIDQEAKEQATFIAIYTATDRTALDTYFQSDACVALRQDGVIRFGDEIRITREIWLDSEYGDKK